MSASRPKKEREVDRWVSSVLSAESGLPPNARFVAVVMADFMSCDTLDNAAPGPARLATMTGLHISTVKRQIAILREREWLTRRSKGGATTSGKRFASVYQGRYPSQCAPGPAVDGRTLRQDGESVFVCDVEGREPW